MTDQVPAEDHHRGGPGTANKCEAGTRVNPWTYAAPVSLAQPLVD